MSRHSESFCRWKSKRLLAAGGEGGGGVGGAGGGGGRGGAFGDVQSLLSLIPSLYCANASEKKIPLSKTVTANAPIATNVGFTMRLPEQLLDAPCLLS